MASSTDDNDHKSFQEESDEENENILGPSQKRSRSYFNDSDQDSDKDAKEKLLSSPRNAFQTPRSSQRLREKSQRRHTIPKRKDVLEKICEINTKDKKNFKYFLGKSLKRRSLTCDFVRGSSRYVTDKCDVFLSSSSDDLSDFIDDDSDEYKQSKSKPAKRKKKKVITELQYPSGSSSSDSDNGKSTKTTSSKRKKFQKKILSSDEQESDKNSDHNIDVISKTASNKVCKNQIKSDDETSSDEMENEVRTTRAIKKAKEKHTKQQLDSDEENTSPNRKLRRRTKSAKKEKAEELLAKMSAKRKLKTASSNTTEALLVEVNEGNVRSNTLDLCNEVLEDDKMAIFDHDQLEEGESDREFVVDDDDDDVIEFCDADSDSNPEFFLPCKSNKNTLSCINSSSSTSKRNSNFRRVCAGLESDESDEEVSSTPEMLMILDSIKENNFGKVKAAIESKPNIVEELYTKRQTLLHHAVKCGSFEITQLLMDRGCEKFALDAFKLPPSAYAVLNGDISCLKILLPTVDDLHLFNQLLEDNLKLTILHFVVYGKLVVPEIRLEHVKNSCLERSLDFFFELGDLSFCLDLMKKKDLHGYTPLTAAIASGQHQCIKFLLSKGADVTHFKSQNGGNLLHFAIECFGNSLLGSAENKLSCCLHDLLTSTFLINSIDATDNSDFTPLMCAAQSGNHECVLELLKSGASVYAKDKHGTTSLHLAAASGDTNCVKLLLQYGHQVDCLDSSGWPPLLYANFAAQEGCVLALMEPNPRQIFVLGELLRRGKSNTAKERNFKVVKDVLVAVANQDAYYRVFNDFIRRNPEFLEQNDKGLLHQTWRGILDFDNKRRWFRRKLSEASDDVRAKFISVNATRGNIFESAMCQLKRFSGRDLTNCSLSISFKDEPGICTGPRKEFFVNVCKDIVDPKHNLFHIADNNQYSLVPNQFFRDLTVETDGPEIYEAAKLPRQMVGNEATEDITDSSGQSANGTTEANLSNGDIGSSTDYLGEASDDEAIAGIDLIGILSSTELPYCVKPGPENNEEKKLRFAIFIDKQLTKNLEKLKFLGKFIGLAISCGDFINLHLSKPLVKQILGIKLNHPDDLSYMDYDLYKNMVSFILESDNVDDLMLPSNLDVVNPWNNHLTTLNLFPENDQDLTEKNKGEYLELFSKYKLTLLIQKELDTLCEGLYQVIPKEFFSIFTADEFSLLINGVDKIDVKDWQNNTKYCNGDEKEYDEIKWFWKIVSELKEEEKALLLKFSTGSPCLPVGGFSQLQGLGGQRNFQIFLKSERNKIPTASTCFNMLNLSRYDDIKQLKDKLLIAIRHGTEGFSFS